MWCHYAEDRSLNLCTDCTSNLAHMKLVQNVVFIADTEQNSVCGRLPQKEQFAILSLSISVKLQNRVAV